MSKGESKEYRTRLKEITSVLHKYGITRGITPQKLRMILEDLGPTYIKIGQIMSLHSDILPKRYCDELMCLRSEVTPMEFPEVKEVIEQAYGCPWNEIFAFISDTPLGSASIAQVHRAELLSGEQVVIKVQRTGIYEIMARDIGLLRKAVKLMPPISLKGMADFDQVLDELWNVTREEMNFLTEASNMEEFARRNADVVYVRTPKLYQEYSPSAMTASWIMPISFSAMPRIAFPISSLSRSVSLPIIPISIHTILPSWIFTFPGWGSAWKKPSSITCLI